MTHASDCAVHNEPAYPAGPCSCGVVDAQRPAWMEIIDLFAKHCLPPPPTRLRDELVAHLLAHRDANAGMTP